MWNHDQVNHNVWRVVKVHLSINVIFHIYDTCHKESERKIVTLLSCSINVDSSRTVYFHDLFVDGIYWGKKKENKKEKKGESEWGVKRVKGCIFSFTVNIKVVPKLKYHKKCSNSCRSILIAFYVDFSFKIETPWSQLYSRQNVFKKKVN